MEQKQKAKRVFENRGADPVKDAKLRTQKIIADRAMALRDAAVGKDDDTLLRAWDSYRREIGKPLDSLNDAMRAGSRPMLIAAIDKEYGSKPEAVEAVQKPEKPEAVEAVPKPEKPKAVYPVAAEE